MAADPYEGGLADARASLAAATGRVRLRSVSPSETSGTPRPDTAPPDDPPATDPKGDDPSGHTVDGAGRDDAELTALVAENRALRAQVRDLRARLARVHEASAPPTP